MQSHQRTPSLRSIGRPESTRVIQLSHKFVFMDMNELIPSDKHMDLEALIQSEILNKDSIHNDDDNNQSDDIIESKGVTHEKIHHRHTDSSNTIRLSRKCMFLDIDELAPCKEQETLNELVVQFLDDNELPINPDSPMSSSSGAQTPDRKLTRDESIRSIQLSRKFFFLDLNEIMPGDKQDELEEVVQQFLEENKLSSSDNPVDLTAPASSEDTLDDVSVDSSRSSTRIIQLSHKFVFLNLGSLVPETKQDELEERIQEFLEKTECADPTEKLLPASGVSSSGTVSERKSFFPSFCAVM